MLPCNHLLVDTYLIIYCPFSNNDRIYQFNIPPNTPPLQTLDDPDSPPFLTPVDPSTPQYLDMIQTPMDLGTISRRLNGGEYSHPRQFLRDMQLVWFNCGTYNEGG